MLPVTQEMAEEESKQQGGMNRQATAAAAEKGDPPVVTMAQPEPEGFTEVWTILICSTNGVSWRFSAVLC